MNSQELNAAARHAADFVRQSARQEHSLSQAATRLKRGFVAISLWHRLARR